MKYKSNMIKWVNGEDIFFSPDGTLTVDIKDPASETGVTTKAFVFKDWKEVKGNGLSLKDLYEDTMPEFIEGDKLKLDSLMDIFPDIKLTFNIDEEDIYRDESLVDNSPEKERVAVAPEEVVNPKEEIEIEKKTTKKEEKKPLFSKTEIEKSIKEGMSKDKDREILENENMSGKKSKQINIKMSEAVHNKLTKESEKLGLDKTSFISMLISNYKGVYFYKDEL